MKTGYVYRIIHNQSDIVYVGSTFNKLKHRWQGHKSAYRTWTSLQKKGCSIYPYFEKHGVKNFKIILIKEYEVCDKKHLRAYEQLWINRFKCCNMVDSFGILKKIKDKLYREENREKNKIYKKIYQKKNKDRIKEKKKEYYQKNKDQIKEKTKEYYRNNKIKSMDQMKQYREKNKAKISQQKSKKIQCECGSIVSNCHIARHRKTKKHEKLMSSR